MLSVPPDPQCSNLQQTIDIDIDDDRDHDHLPSPLPVVDLPDLTPNFSIRNYVFTARSKDIKTNWPFSPKNLQLCLKHGVKDVLPPFQPLKALRNQICRKTTGDNDESIYNNVINGEPAVSERADHTVLESINHKTQRLKLPRACVDTTTPCRSGESNLFPSEIEEPVQGNKSTTSPLQTFSVAPRAVSHKIARTSGKNKCKLVVKFGSHSDRSSTEDIASNNTTQSETMASKICPVCKTFSSSSNTTLNAHIDQCLSAEESTPKWTVDSKLSKFRIKPRKTRLMVDVYSTALPCTLEDLDRRNGTNWACTSSLPTADPESDEPVKQGVSPAHRIDIGDVYIDANGIKVRILSKSDDAPSMSRAVEHLRPKSPIKGSRLLSARKKKQRASKFSKYLKLAQNKKLLSMKALSSQTGGAEGKNEVAGANSEEGYNRQKQINSCSYGALRQWACSKRTGAAKKFNKKLLHHHSRLCQNHKQDELGNSVSALEKTDGLDKVLYEAQPSCVGEGAGSSLSQRPLTPMKRNACVLRKETSSEDGYHVLQFPKSTAIDDDDDDDDDPPPAIRKKQSRSCHTYRSKDMKVSSSKKDMLSCRTNHVAESSSVVANNDGGLRKSQSHLRSNEEIVALEYGASRPYDREHRFSVNYHHGREDLNKESSLRRYSGLTIRQNTRSLKESVVSESSHSQFHSDYPHDRSDDVGPGCKDFRCSMDDTVSRSSPKTAVKENIAGSCESGNPELNRLVPLTKICSNSLLHKGLPRHVQVISSSSGKSVAGGGQSVFYANQLENDMPVQNVNMGDRDPDSEAAHGSFFPEVDPISIPGPPGSFLPSPRDMGSDDFQGNSSLTTSRVQSSQDHPDFIDGDSSDSPVSATSTISNSTARAYDLKSSESLPYAELEPGRDNIRLAFSGGSVDSSTEYAALVSRSTTLAAERFNSFDIEKSKVNKTTLGERADTGPCCCQRKERADHVFLTQDSQLLKRRMIASDLPSCSVNNNTNMEVRDVFCARSCPSSEKAVPSEHALRGRTDGGAKLLGFGDRDSMSPSSSNSILRLMGKNLMVVNKAQDELVPPERVQPQPQTNQFIAFTSLSPTDAERSSFPLNSHRPSVNHGRDLHVDTRRANGIRIHPMSDPRMHYQAYSRSELRECYSRPASHMDQVLDQRSRNLLSAANDPAKEIIMVDEASECEADFGNYRGGFVGSSSNIGVPSYIMYAEEQRRQANASAVRWPSVVQQTPPSSRGQLRSYK